jgi:hypothetical protein
MTTPLASSSFDLRLFLFWVIKSIRGRMNDQTYRVPWIPLNFFESGEVEQPTLEFVDIVLDGVVV